MSNSEKRKLRERFSGAVRCKGGCGRMTVSDFGICWQCRRDTEDIIADNMLAAIDRDARRRQADDEAAYEARHGGVGVGAGLGRFATAGGA